LVECTFTGNSALGGNAVGGGLRLRHAPDPPSVATVSGCVFTGNHAQGGGGAYVSTNGSAITDCVFTDNSTLGLGGGLNFSGPDSLLRAPHLTPIAQACCGSTDHRVRNSSRTTLPRTKANYRLRSWIRSR
jgi:hypothetical protein